MGKWVPRDSNPEPKDYESSALTVELETLKERDTLDEYPFLLD